MLSGLALIGIHGSNIGKSSFDLEEESIQYGLAEVELEF